jgi:hypothetical protein
MAYVDAADIDHLLVWSRCHAWPISVTDTPHPAIPRPNILRAAKHGLFRVFGDGDTEISMTYVDNFCHGLMLAEAALMPSSPILGNFYIVTDGPPCNLWRTMDEVVKQIYGDDASIFNLYALPGWFMMGLARVCDGISAMTGISFKLNTFAVKVHTCP